MKEIRLYQYILPNGKLIEILKLLMLWIIQIFWNIYDKRKIGRIFIGGVFSHFIYLFIGV